MKPKLISDLKSGDKVLSFFVVRKKEIKERKLNKTLYLSFEFGDRSGRIRGSIWENIHEISKQINVSDIVKVKGKVITYQEQPHISIENIRKALPQDNVESSQFLPSSEHDIHTLFTEIENYLKSITNSHLSKLLNNIFNNQHIKQKFLYAPAAKLWHHNYIGGLLEHTLSLVRLCDKIQQQYSSINRDILIAAALLHDLGKITEFETKGFINYSTEGRLLGHITITTQIVVENMKLVPDFPKKLKQQLLHCILSHHGQKENGSPVVPMTMEAMILSMADELDAKLAAFTRIMKKEKEPGKIWSNYVNLLDRFLFLGEDE